MTIDLFEKRKGIQFEDLPTSMKEKIWYYFKKDFNNDLEEFLEVFSFSTNKVKFNNENIILPSTYFDMRGDGQTHLYKELFHNLKDVKKVKAYAVEAIVCKKRELKNSAYVVYELDENELVLIEMD